MTLQVQAFLLQHVKSGEYLKALGPLVITCSVIDWLLYKSINTVICRIKTFNDSTLPIIDHYKGIDKVKEIDGMKSAEEVSGLNTFWYFLVFYNMIISIDNN